MAQIFDAKSRIGLVPSNNGGLQPDFQSIARTGIESYIQIDMRPNPSTSALTNGDDLLFDLEPNDGFNIKDMVLRLRVSCSNAEVQTVPAPYLFKRIRIISNKGSGDTLQTIYPEQLVHWNRILEEPDREWVERNGHIKFLKGPHEMKIIAPEALAVGEIKESYIPLPMSWWQMQAIQLQELREDGRIWIELDSDFVVSGTSTNVSLDAVTLLINQDDLNDQENKEWISAQENHEHRYRYLDVIRITDNSKTLTASSESKFDLQNIVGKCPFLLVYIKPSAAPSASNGAKWLYTHLGHNTKFDLRSTTNESMLGKGNGIRADYLEYLYALTHKQKPVRGVYMIPFTNDPLSAVSGVIDNFFDFTGDKDTLSITFDSAPVQEVHRITASATIDGGSYRYYIGGEFSSELDHDANDAAQKAAIEAIPIVDKWGYTVTSGGNVTATRDYTWGSGNGRVSETLGLLQILGNSLKDGGVNATLTTSLLTRGREGFITGSGYTVEIHAYYYRELLVDKNGRLYASTV